MRYISTLLAVLITFSCTNNKISDYSYPPAVTPKLRFQNTSGCTILLTGASFATSDNGWFENSCLQMSCIPMNLSISGSNIVELEKSIKNTKFLTDTQFEQHDIFVIMHVHNRAAFIDADSASTGDFSETDFTYASSFETLIHWYLEKCYNQRKNPDSKWFGTELGKPAQILICTHWHDARTKYNNSIRKLCEHWGIPLVEFDKLIGFNKDYPDTNTGKQFSVFYASNTEIIDEVEYGWHPRPGENEYIQQKMSSIFTAKLRELTTPQVKYHKIVR